MSYRIGTISVTNGSKAVVGTNTLFATVGVSAGDQLTLVDANGLPTGSMYEVASVTDDTHLTLLQNYQGTTGSGKAYAIIDMAGDSTVPNFARRLAQFYADIGEGASSTVKGLVKLYTALGSNTDGSITQAGLQTLLNGKANTATTYNKTEVDTALAGKINSSAINAASGVAGLDANAKVLTANLPDVAPIQTGTPTLTNLAAGWTVQQSAYIKSGHICTISIEIASETGLATNSRLIPFTISTPVLSYVGMYVYLIQCAATLEYGHAIITKLPAFITNNGTVIIDNYSGYTMKDIFIVVQGYTNS